MMPTHTNACRETMIVYEIIMVCVLFCSAGVMCIVCVILVYVSPPIADF